MKHTHRSHMLCINKGEDGYDYYYLAIMIVAVGIILCGHRLPMLGTSGVLRPFKEDFPRHIHNIAVRTLEGETRGPHDSWRHHNIQWNQKQ